MNLRLRCCCWLGGRLREKRKGGKSGAEHRRARRGPEQLRGLGQ